MKAVVGADGIGYFGVRLAAAGHDVRFAVRVPHLEVLRRGGLIVQSPAESFNVSPARLRATDDPREIDTVDFVPLGVKTRQLAPAIVALGPLMLMGTGTAVVTTQQPSAPRRCSGPSRRRPYSTHGPARRFASATAAGYRPQLNDFLYEVLSLRAHRVRTDSAPKETDVASLTESTESTVDIAIVGAGPAGLYGAYYAGFRGLSTAVIDVLPEPGGQVAAMYPEKLLYDVAAHPGIKGRHLIDSLLRQAAPFDTTYLLGQTATSLTPRGPGWTIGTDKGSRVNAGAVVIAAGLGRFVPRELPCSLPYQGRGLAYHVPRLEAHAERDVVIVGGGDSAVDWALALAPVAHSVTVVHRRGTFRAHEHSVRQLYAAPVRVLTDAQVSSCHGADRLERVEIRSGDAVLTLPAQSLIAALGFSANLGPIADWGVELEYRRIRVDQAMRTNLPQVYAVGDGCTYPGRVPLISVGFGEAATAVNHTAVALRPGERLAPEHSSDASVPDELSVPAALPV